MLVGWCLYGCGSVDANVSCEYVWVPVSGHYTFIHTDVNRTGDFFGLLVWDAARSRDNFCFRKNIGNGFQKKVGDQLMALFLRPFGGGGSGVQTLLGRRVLFGGKGIHIYEVDAHH